MANPVEFRYIFRMKNSLFHSLVLLLILFSLPPSHAEPGISLDTPLEAILPEPSSSPHSFRPQFADKCPQWSLKRPIRDFLTVAFYSECISHEANDTFQAERPILDRTIREFLAPHWLSLRMSKEEIAFAERDPKNPIFMPLKMLDLSPYGVGLNVRAKGFLFLGIHLVRDFLIAYEYETSLPPLQRFHEVRNIGHKTFYGMKSAIDAKMNESPAIIPYPPNEMINWLHFGKNSSNPDIRQACLILLKSIGEE